MKSTSQIIVDYIRVLRWPLFILILSFYYRHELSEILERFTKGKVGGFLEFELTIPKVGSLREILENPKIKTITGELKSIECSKGYDGYFEWIQVIVDTEQLRIIAFDPQTDEFVEIEARTFLNLVGGAVGDEYRDGVNAPLAQILVKEEDQHKLVLAEGQKLKIYTKLPYEQLPSEKREVTLGLEPGEGLWNASCKRYDRIIIADGRQKRLFDARYIFKERKMPVLSLPVQPSTNK